MGNQGKRLSKTKKLILKLKINFFFLHLVCYQHRLFRPIFTLRNQILCLFFAVIIDRQMGQWDVPVLLMNETQTV